MLSPGDHCICTSPGYQVTLPDQFSAHVFALRRGLASIALCVSPAYDRARANTVRGLGRLAPAQSLHETALAAGATLSKLEIDPAGGIELVSAVEKLIAPATKLLVLNFPHNPTGYVPTPAEYAAVVELARSRNVRVFSDEMYRFLELDPADRLPSACELDPSSVTLCGLSKSFGLPGLRLGCVGRASPICRVRVRSHLILISLLRNIWQQPCLLITIRVKHYASFHQRVAAVKDG